MRAQPAVSTSLALISKRECQAIAYLAEGHTHEQIGQKIGLSALDVQQLLENVMQKQGAQHAYELISWAYMNGFLK